MFEIVARVVNWVYGWSGDYAVSIGFMAVLVMALLTPLTLKSTKGMLQMQRLQPELRRIQLEHRGDRQKLNEEMMRLYQENKVNPLASCLPLVAQMPVFIIMFRILHGLTYIPEGSTTFAPKYLDSGSELYRSLSGKSEMLSIGIDLAARPLDVMRTDFARGLIYAGLVVLLALLYLVQQKMVASRTVSPTMSAAQQKLLQYLPVAFAVFQVVLPTGLIVYYMVQAVIRIIQQWYITKRFYGRDDSIGRQAQAASAQAREIAAEDKKQRKAEEKRGSSTPDTFTSKRVTPPKGQPAKGRMTPKPQPPRRQSDSSRRPKPPKR